MLHFLVHHHQKKSLTGIHHCHPHHSFLSLCWFAHPPRCAFAPACELQCRTQVDWKSHVRKSHQNKLMRVQWKSHLLRYIKQEVIQFSLLGKAPAHLEGQITLSFAPEEHWSQRETEVTQSTHLICMKKIPLLVYTYVTALYKIKSWICVLGFNLSYLAAELKLWNASNIFLKTSLKDVGCYTCVCCLKGCHWMWLWSQRHLLIQTLSSSENVKCFVCFLPYHTFTTFFQIAK